MSALARHGHRPPAAAHHTPMTETTQAAAQVPLHHLSTALDEIYLLRAASAYEAIANRATRDMTVPKGLVRVLDGINDDLLVPAARGRAHAVLGSRRVTFGRPGWESQRALRRNPEQWSADEYLADESAYLDALDEIRALRTVMRRAAQRMPDALLFKTLPASRRPIIEQQIDRMKIAAGDPKRAYATRSGRIMKFALTEIAGTHLLNAPTFAAEVARRS